MLLKKMLVEIKKPKAFEPWAFASNALLFYLVWNFLVIDVYG